MEAPKSQPDLDAVMRSVEATKAARVKLGGFDVDGVLRGKSVSIEKLRSVLQSGLGFCDVIFGWDSGDALYDNATFTGWHTGYPDTHARVDLTSFRRVPWEGDVPFFLLDFVSPDGEPLAVSPRQALKRVVARAEERGYQPRVGCEFEFFFFRESPHSLREKAYRGLQPLSPGMFGYSIVRAGAHADLVDALMRHMAAFDCQIEGIHTETGPGVYEVALEAADAVTAADRAMLFKTGVKEIAARHGLVATFMAKVSKELPGCSGHLHQSLWDRTDARNLFAGERPGEPSPLLGRYLAGLLATMGELAPLYLPTVNSYKRLVPGTWAPTTASWGMENRTTAVRGIPGPTAKHTRLEVRVTGADMNAYIAIAGSIAAGLHGIEAELEPPPPVAGNAYAQPKAGAPLPRSLEAALPAFRESAVARAWLGDAFVDHYAATRAWEVAQAQTAVTDWELDRYFEVI